MEHKIELVWFLYITEGTEFIVNSTDDNLWEAEDEKIDVFIEGVEIWYWPCL